MSPEASLFDPAMLATILERRLDAMPCRNGFYWPDLDRQWRRTGDGVGTLVSQARTLWLFTVAFERSGDPRLREAALAGAGFLLDAFRDRTNGGYFWAVDADARPREATKDSYGHAFVLFGLSAAARVFGDAVCLAAARDVCRLIEARFKDRRGGLIRALAPDWSRPPEPVWSQNPVMHYFEALLAFEEAARDGEGLALAADVWRFVRDRLMAPCDGLLPEWYDESWTARPSAAGGLFDVGHAFEWSFLLSWARRLAVPGSDLSAASRLLDWAVGCGAGPIDGSWVSARNMEGGPGPSDRLVWWVQCEAVRALARYAFDHARGDLLPLLRRSADFCRHYFVDHDFGGWYEALTPDGRPARSRKSSVWKLDYHTAGMCLELERAAAQRGSKEGR